MAFPKGFLWGTSTSAFQIEGGVASRGPVIWDDLVRDGGGPEHISHMPDDVARLASLGATAYRFSLAWTRLWKDGDTTRDPEPAGVDFYRALLRQLDAHGIAAYVTLHHWDLPSSLPNGWLNPQSPAWFAAYARRCGALFPTVAAWITINEPMSICVHGYCDGTHAPGKSADPGRDLYTVGHHLLLAHAAAAAALRDVAPRAPVGISLNAHCGVPRTPGRDDAAVARLDAFTLGWFADPIFRTGDYPSAMRARIGTRLPQFGGDYGARHGIPDATRVLGSADFLGLNWYTALEVCDADSAVRRLRSLPRLLGIAVRDPRSAWAAVRGGLRGCTYFGDAGVAIGHRASWHTTAMGWAVAPWGLARTLEDVHRVYATAGHMPRGIIVTENGLALDDEGAWGDRRVAFARAHIACMFKALQRGVAVRGYLWWSLLDNIEWDRGTRPRFGAWHVDFATQRRTERPVARFLAGVFSSGTLQPTADEEALDPWSDAAQDYTPVEWSTG